MLNRFLWVNYFRCRQNLCTPDDSLIHIYFLSCLPKLALRLLKYFIFARIQQKINDLNNIMADKSSTPGNTEKHVRPTWDEYFMELANTAAKRATCDRGRSGCVIVRDKHVLVTGYVGSPMGLPHCDEVGHLFKKVTHEDGKITQHCVRTVHAEQNAICQAARLGISLENGILYCKMTPCRTCAMLIINCGIKRVVCEKKYHAGAESEEMFRTAGVELAFFNEEVEKYDNQ